MNNLITVPFHGRRVLAAENDGVLYVAMKPIVEALGLAWHKQFELINRDPVLSSSAIPMMGMVAKDGKQREMICLPLEYLNGWLFKVSANNYTGKKREAIILYQKECFRVLYDYFHGKNKKADSVVIKLTDENARLRQENLMMSFFKPLGHPGDISKTTGLEKWNFRRGYYTSAERARMVSVLIEASGLAWVLGE